jgi:hypothetical protein
MPPTTSRDFQKAAAQRLTTAETLLREGHTLDAQYLGGYTVECSLKALLLELTPEPEKADTLRKLTAGRECIGRTSCSVSYGITGSLCRPFSPGACGDSIGRPT